MAQPFAGGWKKVVTSSPLLCWKCVGLIAPQLDTQSCFLKQNERQGEPQGCSKQHLHDFWAAWRNFGVLDFSAQSQPRSALIQGKVPQPGCAQPCCYFLPPRPRCRCGAALCLCRCLISQCRGRCRQVALGNRRQRCGTHLLLRDARAPGPKAKHRLRCSAR